MPSIFDIFQDPANRRQFGQYGSPYPSRPTNASSSPLLGGYWGGANNTGGTPGELGDAGRPQFYRPPWQQQMGPPPVDLGIDAPAGPSVASPTSHQVAQRVIGDQQSEGEADDQSQTGDPGFSGTATPEEAWGAAKEYGPDVARGLMALTNPISALSFGLSMANRGLRNEYGLTPLDRMTNAAQQAFGYGVPEIDEGIGWDGRPTSDPTNVPDYTGYDDEEDEGYGAGWGPETDEGWDEEESTGGVSDDENDDNDDDSEGAEDEGAADWAKGGMVTAKGLRGPDPIGPDDGLGNLDVGEYVVRKSAVNHYGSPLLSALNSRKIPKKAISALLKKYG